MIEDTIGALFNKNISVRHLVINQSVLIEELASETLGRLLDIDWKTSITLGYNSTSLSFSHKISLIRDKENSDSDMYKKIESFIQIRNKFAHVREIVGWEDFYSFSKTHKQIETKLNKWYGAEIKEESNRNNMLFLHLAEDIFYFLIQINKKWAVNRGSELGRNQVKSDLIDFIIEKSNDSVEIQKLLTEFKEKYDARETSVEDYESESGS